MRRQFGRQQLVLLMPTESHDPDQAFNTTPERLRGHLRSNGDPGWLVLGRGYHQLLLREIGFQLGQERCDQS